MPNTIRTIGDNGETILWRWNSDTFSWDIVKQSTMENDMKYIIHTERGTYKNVSKASIDRISHVQRKFDYEIIGDYMIWDIYGKKTGWKVVHNDDDIKTYVDQR